MEVGGPPLVPRQSQGGLWPQPERGVDPCRTHFLLFVQRLGNPEAPSSGVTPCSPALEGQAG